MSTGQATAAVRRFIDAFNAEDLDAFAAAVAEDVEIQGRRGLIRGRDEAREWATRNPSGELHQRLILDAVRTDGHPPVALVRRQWWWGDGKDAADERRLGVLVAVDDEGRISRWQPFDDPAEALAAAGIAS